MVRRALRLTGTALLSAIVVAAVACGALALWFDGPASRVLAATLCGAMGFTSLLLIARIRQGLAGGRES
jgi:hypothetical protein